MVYDYLVILVHHMISYKQFSLDETFPGQFANGFPLWRRAGLGAAMWLFSGNKGSLAGWALYQLAWGWDGPQVPAISQR